MHHARNLKNPVNLVERSFYVALALKSNERDGREIQANIIINVSMESLVCLILPKSRKSNSAGMFPTGGRGSEKGEKKMQTRVSEKKSLAEAFRSNNF